MAIKIKTPRKTIKKQKSVAVFKTLPQRADVTRIDSSLFLKHKKIIGGIAIVVIIAVALGVLFKSIFIAAVVNGEPITRFSVISILEQQGGKTTLESLITKKLILQEMKKRNISVTQSDLDSEIKIINSNLESQGSNLDQALTSRGMTKSDLNDELKIQIGLNKMVGTNVTVTEKEIDDFVTANKSQMAQGTSDAQFREQVTLQLKQQKLQTETQNFIKSLFDKAKITHFVSY